jgi:hypothetical protein
VNARSYREWHVAAGHAAAASWPSAHGYGRPGPAPTAATPRSTGRHPLAGTAPEPLAGSFRDSGWAAILVAGILVGFLLLVAGLGSEYRASTSRDLPPPFELKRAAP